MVKRKKWCGMRIIFALLLILFVSMIVWSAGVVFWSRHSGRGLRIAYVGIMFSVVVVASVMTFCYSYYTNANTRVCGFPVPIVVFQRSDPTSQWEDFVGPMTTWGYPVNLVLYTSFPSLIFLWLVHRRRKRNQYPRLSADSDL